MRTVALLLLALLAATAPLAAATAQAPAWDQAAQESGHGLDWPLVFLPEDHGECLRLLHAWNALTPSLPGPGPGEGAGLAVPSLVALLGTDGERGVDPDPSEQVQGWKPVTFGVFSRTDRITAEALGFPIRPWPASGVHVLQVPSEAHRSRIQGFIDGRWLAQGHASVPRPAVASGTGLSAADAARRIAADSGFSRLGWGNYVMLGVALLLLYLGIARGFEPLLLVPIATGCIFVNAIGAGMDVAAGGGNPGGILWFFSEFGIASGMFPLLIFLGVGALTDFGPLLANPWSALLGGAAQFGIFGSFFLATLFGFSLSDAGAIAIIGGADGPTSIYVASKLAPDKLGAIAVAAYSYMALVPILQPPVMRLLTSRAEREIMMTQARPVSKRARILFPIAVTLLCILLLPAAVPLIGMLMFGNLLRESGVTDRLSKTAQNELINLVTIGLGLAVGTKLSAAAFLNLETLGILVLGCVAFVVGTAAGVLFGKLMCAATKGRVNPLIGAAGVSAVPMAARVVQVEGARARRGNTLLMHAMGPNVAGVIGSAVAAGILLALLQ